MLMLHCMFVCLGCGLASTPLMGSAPSKAVKHTDNSSDALTLYNLKLVLTLTLVLTWMLVPTWMLVLTSAFKGRFLASNRRYPCLLWGALANSTEKKIKNPSTIVKMKQPSCQQHIWNFSQIFFSMWKYCVKTYDFSRQIDDTPARFGKL